MPVRLAKSSASTPPVSPAVSLADIAHELNSLLDGSLRSLTLAERALSDSSDSAESIDAIAKLRMAQGGLRDMAELLERAMHSRTSILGAFDRCLSLIESVNRAIESLRTLAHHHRVEINIQVSSAAGRLRTGPLGPVILNGLRNAIEACTQARRTPRRVELSATVSTNDELILLISDSGPGVQVGLAPGQSTKSDGHGIGLELCRRIVADVQGTLELFNVAGDRGAMLRVAAPLARLVAA